MGPIERELSPWFLQVVEQAAIAAAHTMGMGDPKHSDRVAIEAMRRAMGSVPMRGTIIIGEGERHRAPMLHVGEKVGRGESGKLPEVDVAADPAGGQQPVRHRSPECPCGGCGQRAWRPAACAPLLHGEDHRGAGGAGGHGPGCPGGPEP